jgi:alpha-tubulin suppressor-like RCC1 family protein
LIELVVVFALGCGSARPRPAARDRSGLTLWTGGSGYDGHAHSCAVRGGSVWCWGANDDGQLGDGTRETRPTPARALGLHDAVAVTLGSQHTCALDRAGAVWCWGRSLGRAPARVAVRPLAEIAGGRNADCGVDSSGEAWCWGDAFHGELGPRPAGDRGDPGSVPDLPPLHGLTFGFQHVCGVDDRARAICWGNDDWGGVGRSEGASRDESRPFVVEAAGEVGQVDAGYRHTCAVDAAGRVRCWGGVGSSGGISPVAGLPEMKRVACGDGNACGLAVSGRVFCWTIEDGRPSAPDEIALPGPAADVAASASHACAIAGSSVYCWGSNANGQLGDGTTRDSHTPVEVLFPQSGDASSSAHSSPSAIDSPGIDAGSNRASSARLAAIE